MAPQAIYRPATLIGSFRARLPRQPALSCLAAATRRLSIGLRLPMADQIVFVFVAANALLFAWVALLVLKQ